MAEIEFSALSRACLKGRNPDADALQRQITAYKTQRSRHHRQLAVQHQRRQNQTPSFLPLPFQRMEYYWSFPPQHEGINRCVHVA